jgi:DNA-binding IclR family transcriptional regulator
LTEKQASRLLSQPMDVCERILQELEREGMLKRTPDGAYYRRDLDG